MEYVNSVVMTGTIAGDIKKGTAKDGKNYVFTSIAIHRREPSKVIDYFNVAAFGESAEALSLMKKGDPVSIRGYMEHNKYNAEGNVSKDVYRLVADSVTRVVTEE